MCLSVNPSVSVCVCVIQISVKCIIAIVVFMNYYYYYYTVAIQSTPRYRTALLNLWTVQKCLPLAGKITGFVSEKNLISVSQSHKSPQVVLIYRYSDLYKLDKKYIYI